LGIMGNYMATATLLKTFANQPPEGAPELPIP